MQTKDAIDYFGSTPRLAQALGITRKAIYQWGDEVPPARAIELERMTRGELRAVGGSDREIEQ